MNSSGIICLTILFISLNGLADPKRKNRSASGNGKLPSKCELYVGKICDKYLRNVSIFVQPLQPQKQMERRMKTAFALLPKFISTECIRYAIPALCLVAFAPCDLTVNYPKRRQFCQEECRALEEHVCVNEASSSRRYISAFFPPCSQLPAVGSEEHKKCLRLNVKVEKPVFKLKLKNETVEIGNTVVLKCKFKQTKIAPTITWYKDGQIIQPDHPFYKVHLFRHSSRMKIRRAKKHQSGKFTCEVSNVLWKISSSSWITVVPSTKTKGNTADSSTNSSCGLLKPSSVCGKHLKNQLVYFRDSQKQYDSDRLIHNATRNFQGSRRCLELATAAMCYHMYPACVKGAMKRRLCKEDCLMVKRDKCQRKVPARFPSCSGLPRLRAKKGRHCDRLPSGEGNVFGGERPSSGMTTAATSRCKKYQGENFCKKYLGNGTIFYYDMQQQYNMEFVRRMFFSLGKNFVSDSCLKFGIPGICYHLYPACQKGERKSRLCKEDCERVKADACSLEVSQMKKISESNLDRIFPKCSSLPTFESSEGKYCAKLAIPDEPEEQEDHDTSGEKAKLHDSSHKCYNGTGAGYLGVQSTTEFGKACISWLVFHTASGWSHNYCRNPMTQGQRPWCYVDTTGRKEYCPVPKCALLLSNGGESTSLGRTIYVVIAIVAVIFLGCVTIVVYWKVQNAKESADGTPQDSGAPFAKCSSTHLDEGKDSTEVKSFIMKERMSRGKVKYINFMGEGSFCKVFRGELVNESGNSNINIIIKALSEDASVIEKDTFARETSLLCPLQHVNILGLLGVSPYEETEFVVFEYLSETNLHQFLKLKSPQSYVNEHQDLSENVLTNIATQIANGMKYLAEFNYIHGDLAARNCFIAEDTLTVKISMLGIGSHKYPSDYGWLHQGNSLFPIRWMSPETLESLVLTSENDVWAFGVLLWEIFSLGFKPYHQYSNTEVIDKVRTLKLLQCSENWSFIVRTLIADCWSVAPSMRPSFETIYERLSNPYASLLDGAKEVQV